MKALASGYNDRPQLASRPFDRERSGFVLGEGAGVVVLEDVEHARGRGAPILAEIVGYGRSGDAFHMTQPHAQGEGAYQCMARALRDGGLDCGDVGYINAHATSTPLGDRIEQEAIARLFGGGGGHGVGEAAGSPWVSSTKGSVGHLLGAAGAVEAVFTVLSLASKALPPNMNLGAAEPLEEAKVSLVSAQGMMPGDLSVAMSNSFGFGGTNSSLVFAK